MLLIKNKCFWPSADETHFKWYSACNALTVHVCALSLSLSLSVCVCVCVCVCEYCWSIPLTVHKMNFQPNPSACRSAGYNNINHYRLIIHVFRNKLVCLSNLACFINGPIVCQEPFLFFVTYEWANKLECYSTPGWLPRTNTLLGSFVSNEENEVLWIRPRSLSKRLSYLQHKAAYFKFRPM